MAVPQPQEFLVDVLRLWPAACAPRRSARAVARRVRREHLVYQNAGAVVGQPELRTSYLPTPNRATPRSPAREQGRPGPCPGTRHCACVVALETMSSPLIGSSCSASFVVGVQTFAGEFLIFHEALGEVYSDTCALHFYGRPEGSRRTSGDVLHDKLDEGLAPSRD